jgi:quinol monooxygenase YgiN
MVIYVATIYAKPGHDADVTRFYQNLEPLLREASGYRGRRILRARTGTMAEAIRKVVSAEELARHPEAPPKGTHFVMVEEWDSVEQRIAFARGTASAARAKELFPFILPEHSHEFYEDVTPAR